MRYWLAVILILCGKALASPCPVTVGTLTLNVYQPRTACISPCLLFFDTTGSPNFLNSDPHHTTDTATLPGQNDPILDIYYAWSFGDPNASGTAKWAYGSRAGVNVKNQATGPIAAHNYVLPTNGTTDLNTNVQVWAYDGTNIATCTVPVTIFAPSGANGFPGNSTICVAAASTPVAGSGGCPSGAAVSTQATLNGAVNLMTSGKRVLLKCGDTFTGNSNIAATVSKVSIGAYGGCENTTTSRPILNSQSGNVINIVGNSSGGASDIRISDLDFEDGTHTTQSIIVGYQAVATYATQVTMYNLRSNQAQSLFLSEATQTGVIDSVTNNASHFSGFPNVGGSACINQSNATFCGFASYNQSNYANVSYNALMGSSWDESAAAAGTENVRFGVCRLCVFSNNSVAFVFGGNSLLKINEGKTPQINTSIWDGQYTEVFEISDNYFSHGGSNSYGWNIAPENASCPNACYNEQHRYAIIERNLMNLNNQEAVATLISVTLVSIRNNVVYLGATSNPFSGFGIFVQHQGGEPTTQPGRVEAYNNTCYAPNSGGRLFNNCVQVPANTNSIMQNNLVYSNGPAVPGAQFATGNVLDHNTGDAGEANSTVNFNPTNASGTFGFITDFKPASPVNTAVAVPNYFDATGLSWIGAYNLGALSKGAPAP